MRFPNHLTYHTGQNPEKDEEELEAKREKVEQRRRLNEKVMEDKKEMEDKLKTNKRTKELEQILRSKKGTSRKTAEHSERQQEDDQDRQVEKEASTIAASRSRLPKHH